MCQSKASDGGLEDGLQIMIIRLGVRMQRSAKMVRREWMHNAGVEARLPKRLEDRFVIDAGHFHSHHQIGQAFRLLGLRGRLRHRTQRAQGVLHRGRFDEHSAVEVTEHPFGPALGTVHRQNSKATLPPPPGLVPESDRWVCR